MDNNQIQSNNMQMNNSELYNSSSDKIMSYEPPKAHPKHRRVMSMFDTRKMLTQSRKEGLSIDKLIKMPNGVDNAIDLLNNSKVKIQT